ncbi:MAG: M20/M25/M40 family metallo-hydrolase [Bacteroidales bacterium]|nr:M20/M25/M40 family metallo-hydrolase [Bacteroidales bacterium]
MINYNLFESILGFDSTSGKERPLAEFLLRNLKAPKVESFEVGDGTLNLLFSWGEPRIVYCTHMDTVPPYIAPKVLGDRVTGRGSCDAKGQIIAMYSACCQLAKAGKTGFGLLLLSGEETGSWGAKAFSKLPFKADTLVIGEPTENKMVSASKGTKAYELTFRGESFHSGYPQFGKSAVELFIDFANALRAHAFPFDPTLGDTTYNIGKLVSNNAQNILSPELKCRVYFRTTFASDGAVHEYMMTLPGGDAPWQKALAVNYIGGDIPSQYTTFEGFPSGPVAFGSDAPHLTGFRRKIICGPGSIRFAHRSDEHVLTADLETAARNYIRFFNLCNV